MSSVQFSTGRDILGFTPAKLTANKRWYIEWYSFDPEAGKLRRKRVAVPHIAPQLARKRYAAQMVQSINNQLSAGWNPFLESKAPKEYALFDDVCEQYRKYLFKMLGSGLLRAKTHAGYTSFLKGFREWNTARPRPITYAYQVDGQAVDEFLDHVWVDLGKSPRTRDNYLGWLRSFGHWMMEKHFIREDPTAEISPVMPKKYEKNRTVIPKEKMLQLRRHLENEDKYFLLACYILYYCLIRPKEMSCIRLSDINVQKGIIVISSDTAKNKKAAAVTLPDCVVKLMLELNVLTQPSDWYLFSIGNKPGAKYRLPKFFADDWNKVRTALGWPAEYKFYSLKDTGITDLIREHTDLISVRDQARHSSLQMTDLYTPIDSKDADETIRHRQSYF